jgi:hypothetical protein
MAERPFNQGRRAILKSSLWGTALAALPLARLTLF